MITAKESAANTSAFLQSKKRSMKSFIEATTRQIDASELGWNERARQVPRAILPCDEVNLHIQLTIPPRRAERHVTSYTFWVHTNYSLFATVGANCPADTGAMCVLAEKCEYGVTSDQTSFPSILGKVSCQLKQKPDPCNAGLAVGCTFDQKFSYNHQFAPAMNAVERPFSKRGSSHQ